MVEIERNKLVACMTYVVVFMVAYAVIGSYDVSYDAAISNDPVSVHNLERALSTTFSLAAVLGLLSLWPLNVGTWFGGIGVGLLTAAAAGGFHVMIYVGSWLPMALAVGLAGGFALFATTRKGPAACAIVAVELALAALQMVFVVLGG